MYIRRYSQTEPIMVPKLKQVLKLTKNEPGDIINYHVDIVSKELF